MTPLKPDQLVSTVAIDSPLTAGHHSVEDAVAFALRVMRPVLRLAPSTFLDDTARWLADWGVQRAVAEHDTPAIYDWVVPLLAFQGIGDVAATRFAERHEQVTWIAIDDQMRARPSCPRLGSYWNYAGCGYRKGAGSCGEPAHIADCFVLRLPLRKGALNQAAVSLYLFLRDVCSGDFVRWIDTRLAAADAGQNGADRSHAMQAAVLEPLCNVAGTGPKLWAMILADLLLAADPSRGRWVVAGASMTAVDSLVHAFLSRTGILARFETNHTYGPACFGDRGCANVIEAIAGAIDARDSNPAFPAYFPRFVEKAVWYFCAETGLAICNGRRIDDRTGCKQVFCPSFGSCDRLPLGGKHA